MAPCLRRAPGGRWEHLMRAVERLVRTGPGRWRRIALLALLALLLSGCNPGAYPLDIFMEMHYEPSQRRLEPRRLAPPADAVPVTGGRTWVPFDQAAALQNPVPDDQATRQRAQQLYAENCAMCHGADGHGKGPLSGYFSQAAPVAPVDFASPRVRARSGGQLFWIVQNGLGNMPPFRDLLSDSDIWALVRFIRAAQGAA
jgi:mono/diheme cytochrome c family protein